MAASGTTRALALTVAMAAVAVTAGVTIGAGPSSASSAPSVVARTTDAAGTVWLCAPGLAHDPCAASLATTVVQADGSTQRRTSADDTTSAFDCFYVYPTVSSETGDNADLTVQPAEIAAAVAQASRFSSVCRVWAPMYRQRTEGSLAKGLGKDPTADTTAYDSVLSAWRDYLAHDNHGRPVIFIGHSQGAAMLIRLLRGQIDPNSSLRRRLVSAIILGGNVQVRSGTNVGGSFRHIPACRSATQVHCVIAYSSFLRPPPGDSLFGRPGSGVSLQSGQKASAAMSVVCTNPAHLSGGSGELVPYFLRPGPTVDGASITTAWVSYPGLYRARCESAHGATWLQVTDTGSSTDGRPRVSDSLGPTWGLHLDDVNLALGNLVADVARQESTYRRATQR